MNEDDVVIEAEDAMQKLAINFISKEIENSEKTVESIMEDVKKIQERQMNK